MSNPARGWLTCLFALAWLGTAAAAERPLTKEQQLNKLRLQGGLLLLEQRRVSLETLEKELQTTKALFDQGFVALQKLNQTTNTYEEARLNYEEAQILLEETKLNLLKTATQIVVAETRKYKSPDGKSMVDIVLENASDLRDALLVDESLTEEELRTLLKVESIYVSLRSGPVVGEPYEQVIPALEVGGRESLTFRLLQDRESVLVALKYLDLTDNKSVILIKGSQQDLPSINSAQFSQSGELNQEVRFDLTLERLSEEERSFAVAVLGLPQRIESAFVEQGAKITQVKFSENTSKVRPTLQLKIPEKLDPALIGRTRTFFALVASPEQFAGLNALKVRHGDRPVPEEEVAQLGSNYVKLELIPKGVGRLEVLVANRYQEVKVGEELQLRVEFLNRGTLAVQNVKAVLDLPYEWESTVDPILIKAIEPGERAPVKIAARPAADIAVGDYELGIEAQGQVGTENIESLEKNITIHIGARSNLAGNAILIGVLVLLVLGIGVASVRISRR